MLFRVDKTHVLLHQGISSKPETTGISGQAQEIKLNHDLIRSGNPRYDLHPDLFCESSVQQFNQQEFPRI